MRRAAKVDMKWEPIETAPDEVRVLVYVPINGGGRILMARKWGYGWEWLTAGSRGKQPSHWQPLPEPPK